MNVRRFTTLFLLVFALVCHAEQSRVVVAASVVAGEMNGLDGQATLWQSLIMTKLLLNAGSEGDTKTISAKP